VVEEIVNDGVAGGGGAFDFVGFVFRVRSSFFCISADVSRHWPLIL
jgi:hypothetical protein